MRAATRALSSALSRAANALPSRMRALIEIVDARAGRRISLDFDHGPSPVASQRRQHRIGIDRDRMSYPVKQWNVVARVAVEPALPEIGQPLPALGQPRLQARDLAFAHVGRTGDSSGVALADHLRLRRDQMLEAQLFGD